jgi:hypothetical protein
MKPVGSSLVSATTQTPASGPLLLVTTPPMSSLSIATALPPACRAPIVAMADASRAAPQIPGYKSFLMGEPPMRRISDGVDSEL